MVPQVNVCPDSRKAPVLNGAPEVSVVVAVSPVILELVPQAKPRTVEEALLLFEIVPLKVAEVSPIEVAFWVVTVGAVTVAGLIAIVMAT